MKIISENYRKLSYGIVSAGLLLVGSPALANPWSFYDFQPRALSMGGALTSAADDYTAVFYNPAGLTIVKDSAFGFGLQLSFPELSLNFDNPGSANQALHPENAHNISFGAHFPLGGPRFTNRIAIGLGINVPTSSLLDGQALDPAIPHWYMYQTLPRRLVAVLGLGVSPWDWLSLGASIQILAGVSGALDYEIDIVAGRFVRKTVGFDIEPRAAPILGFELRPIEGLRIGGTYRESISTSVELPVDLTVTGLATLLVSTEFQVQYMPDEYVLGVSYFWQQADLQLSFDLAYQRWSAAPDPSVRSGIDAGGELLKGTGLETAFDAPGPGQARTVELGFRDAIIPRIGLEKKLGPLRLRGGYALRPSPAPLQTTGTNYVDTTAHQFNLGGGLRFHDPLQFLANPLSVDLGVAVYALAERRHQKVDSTDPIGSYTASGMIYAVSMGFRYEFGEAPAKDQKAKSLPFALPAHKNESSQGSKESEPRNKR